MPWQSESRVEVRGLDPSVGIISKLSSAEPTASQTDARPSRRQTIRPASTFMAPARHPIHARGPRILRAHRPPPSFIAGLFARSAHPFLTPRLRKLLLSRNRVLRDEEGSPPAYALLAPTRVGLLRRRQRSGPGVSGSDRCTRASPGRRRHPGVTLPRP